MARAQASPARQRASSAGRTSRDAVTAPLRARPFSTSRAGPRSLSLSKGAQSSARSVGWRGTLRPSTSSGNVVTRGVVVAPGRQVAALDGPARRGRRGRRARPRRPRGSPAGERRGPRPRAPGGPGGRRTRPAPGVRARPPCSRTRRTTAAPTSGRSTRWTTAASAVAAPARPAASDALIPSAQSGAGHDRRPASRARRVGEQGGDLVTGGADHDQHPVAPAVEQHLRGPAHPRLPGTVPAQPLRPAGPPPGAGGEQDAVDAWAQSASSGSGRSCARTASCSSPLVAYAPAPSGPGPAVQVGERPPASVTTIEQAAMS